MPWIIYVIANWCRRHLSISLIVQQLKRFVFGISFIQPLPIKFFFNDDRHTFALWNAQCALDADLRSISARYRDIAGALRIEAV